MRIGLDGIPLATPKTGVGHYTFELARSLAAASPSDDFELISPFPYDNSAGGGDGAGVPPNLRLTRAEVNSLRKRWWTIGLPLYARRASYSVFHGTNYNVPLWNRCATVVTIHDLSLFLHPETHEQHLVRRAHRRMPVMARAATAIITPSESVKREVCEHLGVRPGKVYAVPEAPRREFKRLPPPDAAEALRRFRLSDGFILFVGTIEPRKNLITLARALDEIVRTTSLRPLLVVAGKQGWLTDELYSFIRKAGIEERVRFTGYVTEEELCALYSACAVCVYPSLYEGFGLPPLEAMACGAPVITSRIPSIKETVGEAARLVEPADACGLAREIVSLLEDDGERRRMSSAGIERASRFSWDETAKITLGVYEEVLRIRAGKARAAGSGVR